MTEDNADNGYPHDGRANKNPYQHDRRADKDSYPHDSIISALSGADPARVHVHPPCVRVNVHSVLNARSTLNV